MHADARAMIEALELTPHPEGGYYRETYRSELVIEGFPHAPRAASTAIYYLLPAGVPSLWHRLRSDEVWHHYAGDQLDLHTIDTRGRHRITRLGHDYAAGVRPQHTVPAGVLQAALPVGYRFVLCGCTMAPGFDFKDFEMPTRGVLVGQYPQHRGIVEQLTRP